MSSDSSHFASGLTTILSSSPSNSLSNLTNDFPFPVCNGGLLGNNLDRTSCKDAWRTIPRSKGLHEFGERAFGNYEVPLPKRFLGGDGLCAIDVFHRDGFMRDMATYQQIKQAADRLLGFCLNTPLGYPTQGGYVRDIGQNENLVVVLSAYNPKVACYGPQESIRRAEQGLLGTIPAGFEKRVFGLEGEDGVEVVVPKRIAKPRIFTQDVVQAVVNVANRDRVTGRWFDLWAGAVAVYAMCVASGYMGSSSLPGGLSITLGKPSIGVEVNGTAEA